ncbi:MAG: acyl-CoA desaturase [Flavobacteriales bacterium]|nr:acyl-CoA desaturase [Flavobacteriales bacterium]
MAIARPRFSRTQHAEFFNTLRTRVNQYFESNNISRYGNYKLVFKTIFMLALFLVPYFLVLFGAVTSTWLSLLMWGIMGLGTAGIGLSIMHDANHGVLSRYKWLNKVMEHTIDIVGGNASMWKKKHNVLHHTFTNVDGQDDDIHAPFILRFSPHQPLRKIHRFQHWYAWIFYSMLTLMWITYSDFKSVFRFREEGMIRNSKEFRKEFWQVAGWKLFYYAYLLVLPIIFAAAPFWVTLIGFIIMHLVTGLMLSVIFQLAHVMPECEFPMPDDKGLIDSNWAVHQMSTTTNFAPNNKLMSWFIGGLNYQVEHHLFTNISHVHYPEISKIVQQTAREFGVPYYSEPRFFRALANHARMLRSLGQPEMAA